MGVEITLFLNQCSKIESWCIQGNLRSPTLNKRRLSGIPSSPVNGRDGRVADVRLA